MPVTKRRAAHGFNYMKCKNVPPCRKSRAGMWLVGLGEIGRKHRMQKGSQGYNITARQEK